VLVTPWATHQHGLLLPEQLGAPLLLGAAMLAARPATARAAGVLAGGAVFAKLPFAVPAALLIAASPARRTAARWTACAIVAQAVASTALFGIEFWQQIITAQVQAGSGLELQIGAWAQASWTLLALVVFAAVALWLRGQAREPALLRTVAAAAVGALAMTITIVKPGTGLNVVVPSEPLLATLAVAGVVWALRTPLRVPAALAAGALGLLLLAQSASLLLDPRDPRPFLRPLSSSPGWKVQQPQRDERARRSGRALPARHRLRRPAARGLHRAAARARGPARRVHRRSRGAVRRRARTSRARRPALSLSPATAGVECAGENEERATTARQRSS
jgi:hypothetical protein